MFLQKKSHSSLWPHHESGKAETQLLAVDLLKLHGAFEADGESDLGEKRLKKVKRLLRGEVFFKGITFFFLGGG